MKSGTASIETINDYSHVSQEGNNNIVIPAVIRGEVITDNLVEFNGRHQDAFCSTNPEDVIPKLILPDNTAMNDISSLTVPQIIEFLTRVGQQLTLETNSYLQEALEVSLRFSNLTRPILQNLYAQIPAFFTPHACHQLLDGTLPAKYLDQWVTEKNLTGRIIEKRAFGTRILHWIAGNVPLVAVISILNGALTKSDNIIKLPSNDPLTATAILRTMIDVDPCHPVTQHFSALYWKGGNKAFEQKFIQPAYLDRIAVWGGEAAIKNARQYINPGLSMISFDPKLSISIIGKEAFRSPLSLEEAAARGARDVGCLNQEACVNARYQYVEGTWEEAVAYGEILYEYLTSLPQYESTKPKIFPYKVQLDALRLFDSFYHVIGGKHGEGVVIVAQEPPEFFPMCRSAIVVPMSLEKAIMQVNQSTQTVGVFPDNIKIDIRNKLALHGAQRIVSLGEATNTVLGAPHDGMEPLRQLVKWVVDEHALPAGFIDAKY